MGMLTIRNIGKDHIHRFGFYVLENLLTIRGAGLKDPGLRRLFARQIEKLIFQGVDKFVGFFANSALNYRRKPTMLSTLIFQDLRAS